jgi:hypothetical protein
VATHFPQARSSARVSSDTIVSIWRLILQVFGACSTPLEWPLPLPLHVTLQEVQGKECIPGCTHEYSQDMLGHTAALHLIVLVTTRALWVFRYVVIIHRFCLKLLMFLLYLYHMPSRSPLEFEGGGVEASGEGKKIFYMRYSTRDGQQFGLIHRTCVD